MSLHQKDQLKGLVFVAPFILGVVLFFIYPITLSLRLAFGKIDSIVGMKIHWEGFTNFVRAFFVDIKFLPMFKAFFSTPKIYWFVMLLTLIFKG